jgi:hypothetical protein
MCHVGRPGEASAGVAISEGTLMTGKDQDVSRFDDESHHGWSPDLGSEGGQGGETTRKAMHDPPASTGKGREVSDEEKSGMHPAETEPSSRFGVGESTSRRGEDIASGEDTTDGYKGASQRPYGGSKASDSTGVDPQGPQDRTSPETPPGDQGG